NKKNKTDKNHFSYSHRSGIRAVAQRKFASQKSTIMQTIVNPSITSTYEVSGSISLWAKFMNYCKSQEHNRLLWLGVILAAHGCILTPITVMAALTAGPSFSLFMTAIVSMAIALVTNLAAMPTKITIPAFILSIAIDIAIIVSCVVIFLK